MKNSLLKNELLKFRKEKSQTRKISEDYIFTNEELETILRIKPKTQKELMEKRLELILQKKNMNILTKTEK